MFSASRSEVETGDIEEVVVVVGSACPLDMILEAVEVRMLGRGGSR